MSRGREVSEREEKRDLTDLKNDGVIKKGVRGPNEVSEMGCGTWETSGPPWPWLRSLP